MHSVNYGKFISLGSVGAPLRITQAAPIAHAILALARGSAGSNDALPRGVAQAGGASDAPAALRIVSTTLTVDKLAYGRYHLIGEPMQFGFGPQREDVGTDSLCQRQPR
jgi:hypothetical protein